MFLHPWALILGGVGLSLPVLIHWLTRPRPVRFPLSTLRFVQEAIRQRRTVHRLRDILILLLRAAAVGLLAWAFARPLVGRQSLISDADSRDATRVVLVDSSQSMAARARGIELFERARPAAAEFLTYRQGLRANLILAGARPRAVFEQPSNNFAALREELARAGPLPQRIDVPATLTLASEMLAAAPGRDEGCRRELVIVSDFQRSNWAEADFSPLPSDTSIQLESVTPPQPLSNIGVLRVLPAGRPERGKVVQLEVDVGNFTPAARQVEVEVSFGESSLRLRGVCPAMSTTTLSAEVETPSIGWQSGAAHLLNVDDALAADDQRAFVFDVRPSTVYALLTRERSDQRPSSSFYLERALAPVSQAERQARQRVIRIDPLQIDRDLLASADVIVIDHPGKLSESTANLLASFVRRGRSLLYFTAEPVDAVNLRRLTDAAGSALELPVEFQPPLAGQPRQNLTLLELSRDSTPFAVFGDGLSALVTPLRFSGGLTSRRTETGLTDDLLATYSDGSACLVISTCGTGWLAVLNVDLVRSNLPGSPLFVPLLAEIMERLRGQSAAVEAVSSGDPFVAYLPAEVGTLAGLSLAGPTGTSDSLGELVEERAGILWRWNAAGPPGVYMVSRERPIYAIATTIPPQESDLRGLAPELLAQSSAGGRVVHYRSAGNTEEARDHLWIWFATGCVGCLMLELLVLKLFRT